MCACLVCSKTGKWEVSDMKAKTLVSDVCECADTRRNAGADFVEQVQMIVCFVFTML